MASSYRSRLTTADNALEAVQSGHRVYIHNGCAEPVDLVAALTRRGPLLHDVEIVHMATMGIADYSAPEYEGHFRINSLFIGGNVRRAVQEGRADYTPIFLSEIEGLLRSGSLPIDVCLLQCTPPDRDGYMSLGASVDVTRAAVEASRYVIAEINDQAPRTLGDSFLHVSAVHAFVETSHPVVEYPQPEVTGMHHEIGRRVAELIPDGAAIQTGIGGIPEAVLGFLGGHRDLGIHSEMIPDGAIELMEKGIVNNRLKSLNRGKSVAGFVLGSRRLFDFIHNNPAFEFHATSYCNDPFVIAQNDRVVAVNSALEVDITGQVCADSVGFSPYSGIGGQVDFLRGAARSKGGVPVIALPSTACHGTVSRIVPTLRPGAGVVTSRGDVHYVITEHGTAYLHGKTLRQRAEALIAIAAPEFREPLERAAIEAKILSGSFSLAR
jgi:4-hydroxybutyrate CoA-transferase